jgi:hypothetical protein
MKTFSASIPPNEFVQQMMQQLSGRELGKMVAVKLENPHSILAIQSDFESARWI